MSENDFKKQMQLLMKTIHSYDGKPLTIAVIGLHGCGKSSFINTVLAVLTGEFHERARVGSFGIGGGHVTRAVTSYTKSRYLGRNNKDEMRHGYPTFVDTMGFQNDGNVNVFLENLFEGRVRDGTESNRGQRNPRDNTHLLGNENVPKIDRIIFVASALSREFPEELINAVKLQASKQREILLFGVLTHKDEVPVDGNNERVCEFQKKFKESLGLSPMRFLLCTNYCNNFPVDNRRNPEVELPVVNFLLQVIDPERDIIEKDRSIKQHLYKRMNMKLKTITVYILKAFLVMIYLLFIMHPPSEMRSFCSGYTKPKQSSSVIDYFCELNTEGKIMEKPSLLYLFLFLAFVCYCVDPLFSFFLKYNENAKAVFDRRIVTIFKRNINET